MHQTMNSNVAEAESNKGGEWLQGLAKAIAGYMETSIDADEVKRICAELVEARCPRPVVVTMDGVEYKRLEGFVHAQFEDVMEILDERGGRDESGELAFTNANVLLVGPAGTGKTTLAKSIAEAFDLPFGFISLSAGMSETHVLGRPMPQAGGEWRFVYSRFVEIYSNGGVFLFDEIDAADSNVMIAINAALANGFLVTSDGTTHKRSPKCIVIAAANTWGLGADHQYVGRNQLDAATLDRFVLATVFVDYDAALERHLAHAIVGNEVKAERLLEWVKKVRGAINDPAKKLRRVCSTRLVIEAARAVRKGRSMSRVAERYFVSWSKAERDKAEA